MRYGKANKRSGQWKSLATTRRAGHQSAFWETIKTKFFVLVHNDAFVNGKSLLTVFYMLA